MKPRRLLLACLLLGGVTAALPACNNQRPRETTPAAPPAAAPAPAVSPAPAAAAAHPFGVLIGGVSVADKMRLARELGARYYRSTTAVFTGAWTGQSEELDAARAAGLELVLTVRCGDGPRQPSHPPDDLDAYKKTLGEILDRYPPALLVVENEENSEKLFYDGTPAEYHRELAAAVEVAHSRGIKVTNGGLVSSLVILLVARSYEEEGDHARAEAYLARALSEEKARQLTTRRRLIEEQVAKGKALLAGYRAAGADYVNLHWYSSDAAAFREAVAWLREVTGLPVICNEMGQQQNEDPAQVATMMKTVLELQLPYLIWYSDDVEGYGGARALHNRDGSLRPNGVAFAVLVQHTPATLP